MPSRVSTRRPCRSSHSSAFVGIFPASSARTPVTANAVDCRGSGTSRRYFACTAGNAMRSSTTRRPLSCNCTSRPSALTGCHCFRSSDALTRYPRSNGALSDQLNRNAASGPRTWLASITKPLSAAALGPFAGSCSSTRRRMPSALISLIAAMSWVDDPAFAGNRNQGSSTVAPARASGASGGNTAVATGVPPALTTTRSCRPGDCSCRYTPRSSTTR